MKHHPDSGEFYFIAAGVPEDEIPEALEWAFGNDYMKLGIAELQERWNKNHANTFFAIGKDDKIWMALIAIGKAFLEHKGLLKGGY